MEVQYARLDELQNEQPEIAKALLNAPLNEKNPIREIVIEPYAYGLWKSGWVRRRWVAVWKYQKWRPIPMEKHKPYTR